MRQTIIIGSGGTSSYAIPHLVRYYNKLDSTIPHEITILDRDTVEERNLLRQGFLRNDLGEYKGEALARRLHPITEPFITIRFVPIFVNQVQDLILQVRDTTRKLTLICGADNNMARLRIHIAAYILQDRGLAVDVIDSGNAEFHGQVIMSRLVPSASTFLTGISNALQGSREAWGAFELKACSDAHRVTSVFTGNDNWRDRLTRGEHELGCQDNVVANPQNIAANMLAGSLILQAQYLLDINNNQVGIIKFDTKANVVELIDTPAIEVGYADRIADILAYLKTEEGVEAIFGEIPQVQAPVQATQAPATVRRTATAPRRRTVATPRRVATTAESLLDEVDTLLGTLDSNPLDLDEILNGL